VEPASHRIPLLLKVIYTLFATCAVVIYARAYPITNFLWFCDVALILTVPALWLQSSLLASMMALAMVLPDIAWGIALFCRIVFGVHLHMNDYMFDEGIPLGVRAVSLFHLALPVLLLWLVYRLGYDRRALFAQTLLCWVLLPVTFFVSNPQQNINWVFSVGTQPGRLGPAWVNLLLVMVLMPVVIYLPTHFIFVRVFRWDRKPAAS
jgi:hypothetical protein